jgi:hypothetical protein
MLAAYIELRKKLKETGLQDQAGSCIYSGKNTLNRSAIYMLGYNPGGDPLSEHKTVEQHLSKIIEYPPDWNEYIDGKWRPGGRCYRPGEAPMQKRVKCLVEGIGLDVRQICASNLIFVRSIDAGCLEGANKLAEKCWPVHQFLIEKLRPSLILSIGGKEVFDHISKRGHTLTEPEQFDSGHGKWKCNSVRIRLGEQDLALVSVPHLARYAIDRHPEVIEWVRKKLNCSL